MCHKKQQYISLKQQQGGALAIAVFVIVVMSLLTMAISRNISASSSQTVHEVLGTRALLAAEAGNEIILSQIFPIAAGADPGKQQCPATNTIRFTHNGLTNCVVTTTCLSEPDPVVATEDAFYFVESTGVCKVASSNTASDFSCQNTDDICVSRKVEVEAKAL